MDEAKILQFNNSDEGLLDLAEARRKSGNLDGALSTLFYGAWLKHSRCKILV